MSKPAGLGLRFTKAQAAQINAGMREARRKVEEEFLRDGPCVRVPAKVVCALIERAEHGWDAVPPSADGDPGMPAGCCCKLCEASAEGNGELVPHRDDCPVPALRAALERS